jgi:hypothetical protein
LRRALACRLGGDPHLSKHVPLRLHLQNEAPDIHVAVPAPPWLKFVVLRWIKRR